MTMIVTIIALLAFLVCWGFCFKSMRWFHVVMALLVMGTGCWHLVQLSTVLKTRSAWMKKHYELKTRRDSLEVEQKRLISGAVDKVTEERDNIQDLDSMLTRLLIDQGRVWTQTTPCRTKPLSLTPDSSRLTTRHCRFPRTRSSMYLRKT